MRSCQPETTHFICFHSNVCFLSAFGRELGVYLLLAYSQCIRAKNRHSGRSAPSSDCVYCGYSWNGHLSKPNIQMNSSETMDWPSPDNTTSKNRKLHAKNKEGMTMIAVFQLQYLIYLTMYKMCVSLRVFISQSHLTSWSQVLSGVVKLGF